VYGLQGTELFLCGYKTTAWAPYGSCIVAEAQTEGDEVIFAEIDLTACWPGKETIGASLGVLSLCMLVDCVDFQFCYTPWN